MPSKSQSQASLPANHGGGVMTRASAASTVGGARRSAPKGSSGGGSSQASKGPRHAGGSDATGLRWYTDEASGLKLPPTVILIMSVSFIGIVILMHLLGRR